MMANPLPPALVATYETKADANGPYFPIRLGGKLLAYSEDKAAAELIVSALNTATTAALGDAGAKGSEYAH